MSVDQLSRVDLHQRRAAILFQQSQFLIREDTVLVEEAQLPNKKVKGNGRVAPHLHCQMVDFTQLGEVRDLEIVCCQKFEQELELGQGKDLATLRFQQSDRQIED